MSERDQDRRSPERLRQQATAALAREGSRDLSAEFVKLLKKCGAAPTLFSRGDLALVARTRLEIEVVRNLPSGGIPNISEAVARALERLGRGYAEEQRRQLVADRDGQASVASAATLSALTEAAPLAAATILLGNLPPRTERIRLDDDLLPPPS